MKWLNQRDARDRGRRGIRWSCRRSSGFAPPGPAYSSSRLRRSMSSTRLRHRVAQPAVGPDDERGAADELAAVLGACLRDFGNQIVATEAGRIDAIEQADRLHDDRTVFATRLVQAVCRNDGRVMVMKSPRTRARRSISFSPACRNESSSNLRSRKRRPLIGVARQVGAPPAQRFLRKDRARGRS